MGGRAEKYLQSKSRLRDIQIKSLRCRVNTWTCSIHMVYSCAKALESRCHAATEQQAILSRETYVSFFVHTHYGGAAEITRKTVFKQTHKSIVPTEAAAKQI